MRPTTMVTLHVELLLDIDLCNEIEKESRDRHMDIATFLSSQLQECADARRIERDAKAAEEFLNGNGAGIITTGSADALGLRPGPEGLK